MRRIRSGPTKGKGKHVSRLTPELACADKDTMNSMLRHGRARRADERGQALVEFALIAPLFLMLVVGVIQFAVALNYWLDLQRVANQGARSAAVNCGPTGNSQCIDRDGQPDLQQRMAEDVISEKGNKPDVEICYVPPEPMPTGWKPTVGDAVRVRLTERYRLAAIVNLAKIDLTATATMRLEQVPNGGNATGALPDPNSNTNYVLASHTPPQDCRP
jgi:TadE-like protein